MTYAECLAKKDWACNNPNEKEIRFIDDSSEDSSDEKNDSTNYKRYNDLLPNGKLVRKLLQSKKPKFNKIWRTPGSKRDFLEKGTKSKSRFHNSNITICDNSNSDTDHSITSETNCLPKSSPKDILLDSNAEYLAKKDWACNNPNEKEIRFIEDSSEDSSDEKNDSTNYKRYNDLLPNGKLVRKLLQSKKPKLNKIWRTPGSKRDFLEKGTKSKSRFHNSNITICDNSNSDTDHSITSETNCLPKSSPKDILLDSTGVDDIEKNKTEKCFDIVPRKMAKTEKRKREDSASDVEHGRPISKKTKTNENEVRTKVKRKEKSHDVSSSDGEISDRPSSEGSKGLVVDKTNRNSMNTHLLSSESDNENAMSDRVTSNDISVRDSAANGKARHESSYSSEEEIDAEKAVISTSSTLESVKKQIRRLPKFTQELNDDISKLALLLDRDLIEKNDIWILQCPSDMDCSALVSQRLNLDGSCKLDDGEKTYEAYSYRNTNPRRATLAVPSERNQLDLRRVPITGNIIVEESVKAVNNSSNQIISEPPSRVEFPENLRIRHPLLGIDFSKQPRTAERITHVSSKKKRHSKKHDESYNGSLSLDVVPSDVLSSKKKKKKHKHCEDDTVPALVEQQLDESLGGSAKKKKKKKHKDNESSS